MRLFKITLVGDGGVGKTAMVTQAYFSDFIEGYDLTVEDNCRKQLVVGDEPCLLELLDTPSQEEYTALREQWHRDSDAFMIVYSISSRSTFNKVKKWNDEILKAREKYPQKEIKELSQAGFEIWKSPPRILVGNKADREEIERDVSTQEGETLARELGIKFVETSAKSNEQTMEPIQQLVRQTRKWTEEIGQADIEAKAEASEPVEPLKGSSHHKIALALFKNFLEKIKPSNLSSADDAKAKRRHPLN